MENVDDKQSTCNHYWFEERSDVLLECSSTQQCRMERPIPADCRCSSSTAKTTTTNTSSSSSSPPPNLSQAAFGTLFPGRFTQG